MCIPLINLHCIHKYKSEMLTCESFIHNSNILFINKHVFSIIVCLFIITIDNNFFSHSRANIVVYNNNNIIVIKEARGFKENFHLLVL